MAKPIASNKRDNEKKKQEKRLEKQKKKDERKQSGTNSFDEMIAYVDEHGRLTSIPPDQQERGTISNEAPAIQTPKKEYTPNKGRVEHMNDEKGYGFIKETSQTDKYFFHVSGLLDAIQVGDSVLFDLERGKKGYNAVRIRKQIAD
jgi:cold shock CspA family protein